MYSWKSISPGCTQYYIRDAVQANLVLDDVLADHTAKVFGLDVEWKPTTRSQEPEHPVALIQLSNDKYIILLHLTAMSEIPTSLLTLLRDPTIVKAGVGIQGDVKKIFKDLTLSPIRSCVDLALLARCADNARWKGPYKNPIGLARLIDAYEGKELEKGLITRSDWEAMPLSDHQIEYASNDAHAGYLLYTRLYPLLDSSKHRPRFYSFDCYEGQLYEPAPVPEFATIADDNLAALNRWSIWNPYYDPGPPPERKVPTETGNEQGPKSKSQIKKEAKALARQARREAQHEGFVFVGGNVPVYPTTAEGVMKQEARRERRQAKRGGFEFVPRNVPSDSHPTTTEGAVPANTRVPAPTSAKSPISGQSTNGGQWHSFSNPGSPRGRSTNGGRWRPPNAGRPSDWNTNGTGWYHSSNAGNPSRAPATNGTRWRSPPPTSPRSPMQGNGPAFHPSNNGSPRKAASTNGPPSTSPSNTKARSDMHSNPAFKRARRAERQRDSGQATRNYEDKVQNDWGMKDQES